MALVMVLSLGATAFAAEETGSITITNATKGDVYTLYKIFDASYSVGADGKAEGVSYTITEDNQFFTYLFGADGKTENTYFSYDAETGYVSRKADTLPADIVAYLSEMVKGGTYASVASKTADNKTVVFDNLPYGYYIIDKGADSSVTITSNTPDVKVIDKNQIPGDDFSKLTWDEETQQWVSNTSANIGDMLDYQVSFEATNYHGEKQIKYYTIDDRKGDAMWVEFDSIDITVGDQPLGKGFYHFAGDLSIATAEWDSTTNPDQWAATAAEADWYLVHYDFDNFDIIIPWMTEYTFTGTSSGFTMSYGETADSRFESPVEVVINYSAVVEPSAVIGGGQNNNVWNQAELFWTSDTTDGPGDPEITTATVYALGLDKIDGDASGHKHLAGAVFELYSAVADGSLSPVYVIPTNIDGVYIVDDLYVTIDDENYVKARDMYADYLAAYLNGATQKNEVTSQVNGKLVVLGLEAGTYSLKEIKAPDGYNILPSLVTVEVGQSSNTYTIIADADGNVYDTLEADEGQQRHLYTVTPVTVENSKGVELPSTGGAGTMMLITFGTIIAMAFAVLLITHKKMSVYHD